MTVPTPPGCRALRKGRRSLSGHYYLLTTTTYKRQRVFSSPEAANIVMSSLHWLDINHFIALDTTVVMPDHLHFIAEIKQLELSEVMKKLKGYTARKINIMLGKTGKLWQPGYYDHAIRRNEDMNTIRRYCLNNPVRSGIVRDYHQYPYWYCCNYDCND